MANSAWRPCASIGSVLPSAASARSQQDAERRIVEPAQHQTWQRDSSAAFSSNDGFSVVAPTRMTVPSST